MKRSERLVAPIPRPTRTAGRLRRPADVAALAVHIMSNTGLAEATYDIDGGQQPVS
jgi:hypothetical protein